MSSLVKFIAEQSGFVHGGCRNSYYYGNAKWINLKGSLLTPESLALLHQHAVKMPQYLL